MVNDEPNLLNRSAIVLTPKEPYVTWANSLGDGPKYYESDAEEGPTVFLGPDASSIEEVQAFVDLHFDLFFEHWLDAWCTDQERWPKRRNRRMFYEWFDVRISSMVVDTVREPFELE